MVRSKKRGTNTALRLSKLEKYFVDNLRRMHFLCQIAHVLYLNKLGSDPLLKVKRVFWQQVSGIESLQLGMCAVGHPMGTAFNVL